MKKQEKTSVELSTQKKRSWATEIRVNWQLYLMVLIPFVYLIVFKYYPMFGTQIGFRNYQPTTGIWGSEWVGFKHFERFFNNPQWIDLIKNTMAISRPTRQSIIQAMNQPDRMPLPPRKPSRAGKSWPRIRNRPPRATPSV